MNLIDVSIIIPTFNHLEDCLRPCIESILKTTNLLNKEIIIVENGCTDLTEAYTTNLALTHPGIVRPIRYSEPLGYTKATNEGIKQARGDYLILLNNDTVLLDQVKDTWVNMLLEPFKDGSVGVTGPMQAHCPYANTDFLIFFCVMIKRELFDEIGLLDEEFNPGFGEDTDFCIKAKQVGYTIKQVPSYDVAMDGKKMVGGFPIYHKGEATLIELSDSDGLLYRNRLKLLKRYQAGKVKLNLGCGSLKIPGFVGVDLYSSDADLRMDVRKLDFDDGSVSEINAIHVLEHISPYEVSDTLKEWYRVLTYNGKLVVELPDIEAMCKAFGSADTNKRYELLNCIYGTTQIENPHLFGWYYEILKDHLLQAGFMNIEQKPIQFTQHWGSNFRVECSKGPLPDGYFSLANIDTYRRLINEVPDTGMMVELGVWKGRSLCSVADIIKNKRIHVIGVDLFNGTVGESLQQEAAQTSILRIFKENIKQFDLEEAITIRVQDTALAASDYDDNSIDLVFIDADHAYESVKRDITAWWPKVKQGGVICGHDYAPGSQEGVVKAVNELFFDHQVENDIWIRRKSTIDRKTYDCFIFYNELELLELRLNELASVVDFFVLVEATRTIGKADQKPLYFEENKSRFEKWKEKIIHVVVDDMPVEGDSWDRERHQRECIFRGLGSANPHDIVMVSDVDEIPRATAVIKGKELVVRNGEVYCFDQSLYYYYLNWYVGPWRWSKILLLSSLNIHGVGGARYLHSDSTLISDGGWHFSFMGGKERIKEKIESYSHQEYNTDQVKANIDSALGKMKDVYGRSDVSIVEVPIDDTYPIYLRKNLNKFEELGWVAASKQSSSTKSSSGVRQKLSVTATISTKDRYPSLAMTVMSIANQTRPPEKLLIFDDGEQRDLREDSIFQYIFPVLESKMIEWKVIFGTREGQVKNHQKALEMVDTDLIWRLDDDNVAEPNVLEGLSAHFINSKVGAVGGLVINPKLQKERPSFASSAIEDIFLGVNIQWFNFKGVEKVDHLYSTFVYRREAALGHGYESSLSRVGHREETIFTHEMKRRGWDLIVDPSVITWHLQQSTGGIRENSPDLWKGDDAIFAEKLKLWGITPTAYEIIVLDNGLGDHYTFKLALNDIRKSTKADKIIVCCCYPEVFEEERDLFLGSIDDAKTILQVDMDRSLDRFNIYKWMADRNWTGTLVDAFREMYNA